MPLNSFTFLIYFAVLLTILTIFQGLRRIQKAEAVIKNIQISILFIFSLFFIFMVNWRFCLCVLVVAIISYLTGLWIEKARNSICEKAEDNHDKSGLIAYLGGIVLIGFLGYFKYTNFFIESFNSIFGDRLSTLNIVLPLGISFYVFSALSYLIDVFSKKYKPEKNPLYYMLFIAFFPKITAGPIVRANEFLPQIRNYKGIRKQSFCEGIQIFVFGLFKKIVIADHLGVFVDDVFFAPTAFNTGTVIMGVISYSLQIYFDFSGYSDMAIGIAKIIGFDFQPNFNIPYLAGDISDFWKRWHISLSSWLREYIYIPLGGNRKGKGRTYLNLFLTMLISGLWHGAGWTFIIWGSLHGAVSCVNKAVKKKEDVKPWRKALRCVITFIIVSLLWVVFRASSVQNALEVYRGVFTFHGGISQPYTWTLFAAALLIISMVIVIRKNNGNAFYPILDLSKFWHQVLFFVFCGLTVLMGYFGNTAFIYGKF